MFRFAALLFAALLVALAVSSGCAEDPPPEVVVWIEVDTLRADALGCYGNGRVGEDGVHTSPHIDALAAAGVRFERAYSTAPWTTPSLVSQLTGTWPPDHGALRIEPLRLRHETVPERFRAADWRTAGVMTNFIATERFGFGAGFELWDDSLATGHEGASSHAAVELLLEQAAQLAQDPGEGLFLFAFLFDPHYRYEAHEGLHFGPGFGDRASAPYGGSLRGDEHLPDLRSARQELDEADIEFLRGRYLSEVAHLDAAVGRLVAGLAELGLAEKATLVFTADHGEELMERGWLGHTTTLFDELVRVPLIIARPGGPRGATVEAPVSLVDLGGTLLELATGEGGLGGSRDLWATVETGEPPRRWLLLHSDFEPPLAGEDAAEKRTLKWGVVDAETRCKWVEDHMRTAGGAPVRSRYDLAADGAEERDLYRPGDESRDPGALALARFLAGEKLE